MDKSEAKICWQPCFGGSLNDPTWRRRGYSMIERLSRRGWKITITSQVEDCDVYIFHRTIEFRNLRQLRTQGTITIMDLNDCLLYDPRHGYGAQDIIRAVDYVVATNSYAARHIAYMNPNVAVIPEGIEPEFFEPQPPPPEEGPIVISWHGTSDNLRYWPYFASALRELQRNYDCVFRVMMPEKNSRGEQNSKILSGIVERYDFRVWNRDRFVQDISTSHIGIAPLFDTEFCRWKAHHKVLAYMALGVPPVATDIPPYREVIQHGVSGFLCNTLDDWYESLEALVTDRQLRASFASAGRATAGRFTFDNAAEVWDTFLTKVLEGSFCQDFRSTWHEDTDIWPAKSHFKPVL